MLFDLLARHKYFHFKEVYKSIYDNSGNNYLVKYITNFLIPVYKLITTIVFPH